MSDSLKGLVLEVSLYPVGDQLDIDTPTGATTLQLVDVGEFLEEGGSVQIATYAYDYSSVDTGLNTMELVSGLLEDVPVGTRVNVEPLLAEKWAMVEVDDRADAILALVPHALFDRLAEGVRDPEGQESVLIGQQDSDWVVQDIIAAIPILDGSYLDPNTIPSSPGVDELASQVADNSQRLSDAKAAYDNLAVLTQTIVDQTASWDGRVSTSDYAPRDGDALGRIDGSIWFIRTRARQNLCTNPSFEVSTVDLLTSALSMARTTGASPVSGSYVLRLTNTSGGGDHTLSWALGGSKQPVVEGSAYTWSIYARLQSGGGTDCKAQIEFFDVSDVSLGVFSGDLTPLVTDSWTRLWSSVVAPPGAVNAIARVVNPTASDVWDVDAALFEASPLLGAWFNGDSYDGSWNGTVGVSTSELAGGKITALYELDDGSWIRSWISGAVLKDLDASQITTGYMSGTRIQDYSVPIDKMSAPTGIAAEALTAGNLVHVKNVGGTARVYKADAGAASRAAHGFVLVSAAINNPVVVYTWGYNPYLSSMTPGVAFLSATVPGGVSNSPPTSSGKLSQKVGVALAPSVLNFAYHPPFGIY